MKQKQYNYLPGVSLCKIMMLISLIFVSSCTQDIKVDASEYPRISKVTVEQMLNDGQQVHQIKLMQSIGINNPRDNNPQKNNPQKNNPQKNNQQNNRQWDLSLGKRDIKHVVFEYFESGLQKSILFTKIGEYQVRLGSHQSQRQMTTMMHNLTIVVID